MHNINPIVTAAMAPKNGPGTGHTQQRPPEKAFIVQSPVSTVTSSTTARSEMSPPNDPAQPSPASDMRTGATLSRTRSDESYRSNEAQRPYDPVTGQQPRNVGAYGSIQRQSSFGAINSRPQNMSPHLSSDNFNRPQLQTQTSNMSSYSSNSSYTPAAAPSQNYNTPSQISNNYSNSPAAYQTPQNFPPLTTLPPPGFSTMSQAPPSREQEVSYSGSASGPMAMNGMESTTTDTKMTNVSEGMLENMTPSYAMPVFGGEGYSRSPFAMADDFAAWLFNDSNFGPGVSPMGYAGSNGGMPNVIGPATIGLQAPYFNYDPVVSGYFSQPAPPNHPMAVNSILDTSLPESALSEDKRQQLLDLIISRFNETDHAPVRKQKEELLEGIENNDDRHVLSLHMMQTYIGSF